jgi:hypothetical protein
MELYEKEKHTWHFEKERVFVGDTFAIHFFDHPSLDIWLENIQT